jgi:3-oxoacyl-[acyl-carrier-protein] synthase III
VTISESYAERSLECAEQTCAGFAGQAGFEPEAVDLLVAHASVPGFADRLAARLGIPHERVASLSKSLGRAHTAAPALAIEPLYSPTRAASASTPAG